MKVFELTQNHFDGDDTNIKTILFETEADAYAEMRVEYNEFLNNGGGWDSDDVDQEFGSTYASLISMSENYPDSVTWVIEEKEVHGSVEEPTISEKIGDCILCKRGSLSALEHRVKQVFPTAHFADFEEENQEPYCDDNIVLTADEFDADVYFIKDKKGNYFVTEINVWEER